MPYIIKRDALNDYTIYVIFFPAQNSFYVGKSVTDNLKKTYENHYYGGIKTTKQLFIEAKKEDINPPIYRLETLIGTELDTKVHYFAWAKYFTKLGFKPVCGKNMLRHIENLGNEAQQIYDEIKDKTFEQVCPIGTDLYPNIGKERAKRKTTERNMITFRVQNSEYQNIKKEAQEASLSVSDYCKKKILNGRVINVNKEVLTLFSESLNEFKIRNQLLKQILSAIYRTNRYTPADLKVIQDAIDNSAKLQQEYILEIKDILKLIIEN